jgi:hypothetical protein
MHEETRIALKNYDALIRSSGLDDVYLDWDSETVVYGAGGATFESSILMPGFTGATSEHP